MGTRTVPDSYSCLCERNLTGVVVYHFLVSKSGLWFCRSKQRVTQYLGKLGWHIFLLITCHNYGTFISHIGLSQHAGILFYQIRRFLHVTKWILLSVKLLFHLICWPSACCMLLCWTILIIVFCWFSGRLCDCRISVDQNLFHDILSNNHGKQTETSQHFKLLRTDF